MMVMTMMMMTDEWFLVTDACDDVIKIQF